MIVCSIFEVGWKDEEKVLLGQCEAQSPYSIRAVGLWVALKGEFGVSSHQPKSNMQISPSGVSGLWAASPLRWQPGPCTLQVRSREKEGSR